MQVYVDDELLGTTSPDGKSSSNIDFAQQATAQRVASALNHAIELCGGKKEPF